MKPVAAVEQKRDERDPSRKRRTSRRKRKRWSSWKPVRILQYAAFRAGVVIVTLVPIPIAYRIARGFGRLAYYIDFRHRRVALGNLDLAYGDTLDPELKKRIARQAFESLVMLILDVVWLPRLLRLETQDRYVVAEGLELADEARSRSPAVIYVTAHHGSWEVMSAVVASRGHSFFAVARPLPNERINAYLVRSRESLGQKIVAKYGAISELVRHVRALESLAFVADQDARRHGIFVDFFGRKASTIPSPALLAVKFGVPVVVGHSTRIGATFRFRCVIDRVLWPDPRLQRSEAVRRLTQEINDCMEGFIREEPGQYLWLHRRWKTSPDGEKRE